MRFTVNSESITRRGTKKLSFDEISLTGGDFFSRRRSIYIGNSGGTMTDEMGVYYSSASLNGN